jgi:hypothetical protein
MLGTEMVPETSVIFNQLTRLVAWEDFIKVSRRESFGSYGKLIAVMAISLNESSYYYYYYCVLTFSTVM